MQRSFIHFLQMQVLFFAALTAPKTAMAEAVLQDQFIDVIVISGYPNLKGYRDANKLVVETAQQRFPQSRQSVIIGGPPAIFDWSFAPNFKASPTAKDLTESIDNELKRSATSDRLIYISDHGRAPSNPADPLSSAISTKDRAGVSHKKLGDMLAQTSHDGKLTRVISMHCYGGALHHIAFKTPNMCAMASSDWSNLAHDWKFTPAVFGEIRRPEFDLDRDGRTSMMETYVRAINEDEANFPLQQTSSMAFLDFSLGEGSYSPGTPGPDQIRSPGFFKDKEAAKNAFALQYKKMAGNASAETCLSSNDKTPAHTSLITQVDSILEKMEIKHPLMLSDAELASLPPELRSFYANFMRDERVNKLSRTRADGSLAEKLAGLRAEWKKAKEGASDCVVATTADPNRCKWADAKLHLVKNKTLVAIEDFYQETAGKKVSLGNYYPMFLYFKKAAKFMKVATPDQKETFKRLAQCELKSL